MREILFKAKRKDNGKWVEGYYRADPDLDTHYICGWNYYASENGFERELFEEEINYNTLCQCTGLTDKNGRKIWENDIVNCKKYIGGNYVDYCIEAGYVEMKHGAFGLHRIKYDAYYRTFKDWLEDYEYEVIGNIFDNPELLEGERC